MRPRLKHERQQRGWTQKETAERVGIKEREYRHLEAGTRNPSYKTIQELEKVFKIPQSELLVPNYTPETMMNGGK